MLEKMLKIAVCCILACSFSHEGKASDAGKEEIVSGLGSPRSSSPQSLENDDSFTQQVLEATSSSSPSLADTSVSSQNAGKRKKVLRSKSTGSRSKTGKIERKEEEKQPPLSQGMNVELSEGVASLFSRLTHNTKPKVTPSTSENLFAPKELLPIHLLLALLVDEIKTEMNIHSIVYIPEINMYLGFKHMQQSKLEDLKKALKFDRFKTMKNVINAVKLLCVRQEQDLEKLSIPEDMEMAKELISETQEEQWYQTQVKVMRGIPDKRLDPNTLGIIIGQEATLSNFAPYALYANGQLVQPEPEANDPFQKLKKDKKKKSKSEPEIETKWIEVMLSVTKVKEQPKTKTLKRQKSGKSTPRNRSSSQSASAASSSAIATPSSPRIEETKPLENSASIPKISTQPSLTPPTTGV
jgi:hypothetical protein